MSVCVCYMVQSLLLFIAFMAWYFLSGWEWLLAVDWARTILTCFNAIYKYFEVIEISKNLVCKCQNIPKADRLSETI